MTQRSPDKLSLTRKLLLAAAGLGALAGPVVAGLVKVPLVSAQSAQANTGAQLPMGDTFQSTSGNVVTPKVFHVGGGVSAPKLKFAPDPEYTEQARRAKYQGVCVVSLIVDAQGKAKRVQVVRHLGMGLDKKAVEAVKQYTFEPATLRGQPVAVQVNIEVNFRIY